MNLSLLKCRCGKCDVGEVYSPLIINCLKFIEQRLGKEISDISGGRCAYWNKLKGGAENSRHLTCEAADMRGLSQIERYTVIEAIIDFNKTLNYKAISLIEIGDRHIHISAYREGDGEPQVQWCTSK